MYTHYLSFMLIAPLFLALAMFATRWFDKPATRLVETLHLISVAAVLLLSLRVTQGVMATGGVSALNDWLHVDALAAVFLLIVGVVGFLVGIYSIGYVRNDVRSGELSEEQVGFYYGLFNLFLFTMVLVVTSNNIIMMWVAIEATTLGSAFLVGIYGQRSSLEAAWKYVIICTVGVAFALYGTILVYSDAVNFLQHPEKAILWTEIVKNAAALDPTLLKLAFVFILIGYGTKAGIFPMHAWLPDAHSEAPSPVSAMLSGVLLNCALLVIIRFSIILSAGIGPQFPQTILVGFGAVSVIASALFIFVQKDLKRLLAYSSVENIGLIVLAFGIGGTAGVLAGLLHAINHSLAKSLMFCTSGNVLMKYHSRDLAKVRGMLQVAPFTGILLIVGALTLVGAPPFNIFISKFSIISAGMQSGAIPLMITCLIFLAIVFASFIKVVSSTAFGDPPEEVKRGEFNLGLLTPLAVLMILILILGLYLPPQIRLLLSQAAEITQVGGVSAQSPTFFWGAQMIPGGLFQAAKFFQP